MTELNDWIKQATRCLSTDSAAQVKTEIQEHFESARDAALTSGIEAEQADRQALIALGDPNAANIEFRKVLLTSHEAVVLRRNQWEAQAFCSSITVRWLLVALIGGAVVGGEVLFRKGEILSSLALLMGALGIGMLLAAPFLPVYTPSRSRVFRIVKWGVVLGAVLLAFGKDALQWSWLLACCLSPMLSIEWTRASIRRKLPVARWPRHLYF
jgi:hypothetical protein